MSFFQYGNMVERITTTATAAGTTTFVNTSAVIQVFTGSTTQTVVLPDATTFSTPGNYFKISNQSTGALTLQFHGGTPFTDAGGTSYSTIPSHTSLVITLQSNGTVAGTWTVLPGSGVTVGSTFIPPSGTAATISGLTVASGTFTGTSTFPGTSTIDGSGNATFGGNLTVKGSPSAFGTTSSATGFIVTIQSSTSGGANFGGLQVNCGTTLSNEFPLVVGNAANNLNYLVVAGNKSVITANNTLDNGTGAMSLAGNLNLKGSTSGTITISAGATPSSYSMTLPTSQASGVQYLSNNGSGVLSWSASSSSLTNPTVQVLSGSGTYTRPTSPTPLYIEVEILGGGGGGAGGGAISGANGTAGSASTFSTMSAGGGTQGFATGVWGNGGTSSLGAGPIGIALTGGSGTSGSSSNGATTVQSLAGGHGGSSAFGGAGAGATSTTTGGAGAAGTGGGGGGGGDLNSASAATNTGGGGGSGGYVRAIINSPASTYSFSVGSGGNGGAAGTGTAGAGGAGGTGTIIVWEYYQ